MSASFDRLRFRLPDPEPSPVGLANAGFPLRRGRRFFLGLGEEGGGPIYPSGSRLVAAPQRRTASPKPCSPIEDRIPTSLDKIQARSCALFSTTPRLSPSNRPDVGYGPAERTRQNLVEGNERPEEPQTISKNRKESALRRSMGVESCRGGNHEWPAAFFPP